MKVSKGILFLLPPHVFDKKKDELENSKPVGFGFVVPQLWAQLVCRLDPSSGPRQLAGITFLDGPVFDVRRCPGFLSPPFPPDMMGGGGSRNLMLSGNSFRSVQLGL